ncbi:autotransporter assembly complex protein TamB [Necropsobacter massiliensis]|uniref:autotransporter assembly complex protein TamB n=1 Tax=Necropsobacter massiliensis TaxID=1400001 RepID=UPI0009E4A56E|nr:translocation/assembly module TamB domain-containing protein [Necropsobacter massiliensis]
MTEHIEEKDKRAEDGDGATDKAGRTGNRKRCKRALCAVSAVVFCTVFGLSATFITDAGQRGALRLVDKLMDSLAIERIEGGLQDGLVLNNIRFQSQGVDSLIEQARLQLDLRCLLQGQICVEDLSISGTQIQVDTAALPPAEEKTQNSTPMQRITLPVALSVRRVAVENVGVQVDNTLIGLARFQTALELNNDSGFTLLPTRIDNLSMETKVSKAAIVEAAVKKTVEQSAPEAQSKNTLNWDELEQRLTPPLLAELVSVELPFDMHIQDIQGENWEYRHEIGDSVQQISVPHLQLQADATGYAVALQTLQLESSLGTLQGQGTMQLNGDFPLDFVIQTAINPFMQNNQLLLPESQVRLELSGNLKKQTALSLQTEGAAQALLTAKVNLNEQKTPFSLHLDSQKVQYPFAKNAPDPLQIKGLALEVNGDLLRYQATLNADIVGMGAPKTQIDAALNGGLSHLHIEKFQLNALKGSTTLQGNADWRQGVQWQSELDFAGMNVGEYLPAMPAVVSGKILTNGQIGDERWSVEVPELNIQGSLSQRALNLNGSLSANQEKLLHIPQLSLNYGDNKIALQGELSEQSDLALTVNAPDLRGLLPGLSASLKGSANLGGNIREPNVNVDFAGSRIRFQDLNLDNITLQGRLSSANLIQGNMALALNGLSYNDVRISNATLRASGDEKNHSLQLQSQGEPASANLHLSGNFDRTSQVWKGVLSNINIHSPVGGWKTDQNINLNYDNNAMQVNVSAHCWTNPDILFCFPRAFNAGANGEIAFELKKLNLELVNRLIEQELLKGQLHSSGNVAWFTDKPMQLALQLDGNNLSLAHKIDYRTFRLDVPKFNVDAQLQNNQLGVKSEINLHNQGSISTDLKLQDLTDSRTLGGSLNIHRLNLNLANQLLSSGESVGGEIAAALTFGGNLNAPLINGSLHLKELSAVMKSLPFDIKDSGIDIAFHGTSSTLQGRIQTPDSRLDINGEARWKDSAQWETRVHAKADRFKLNIPSMAKLVVSPDVEMKATPKLLELSGLVDIPWARIAIENLPDSAVSVSDDEVILDGPDKTKDKIVGKQLNAQTQSGMLIRSDLKIQIGDDVNLNAYGLNTNLDGLLSVQQDKGKLGLFGQINLKNGRYASFGQDLLIRKGQISFSGMPSQPMLNIEAIRNPTAMENSSVTAGVKVVGIADAPTVTVFSEPAMSQDQALSYLLTGRSLENSGESGSGGSIGVALLGMGLAKSGKLVGGIGEAFGIQDLNLGTQGVGDSSKVVVSGNITPRLQVKYGVGVFDGLAEFTVRYKLMSQLYLQSVSGVNQAVDLLYQFEF